jgi:hypothetical protein
VTVLTIFAVFAAPLTNTGAVRCAPGKALKNSGG